MTSWSAASAESQQGDPCDDGKHGEGERTDDLDTSDRQPGTRPAVGSVNRDTRYPRAARRWIAAEPVGEQTDPGNGDNNHLPNAGTNLRPTLERQQALATRRTGSYGIRHPHSV